MCMSVAGGCSVCSEVCVVDAPGQIQRQCQGPLFPALLFPGEELFSTEPSRFVFLCFTSDGMDCVYVCE